MKKTITKLTTIILALIFIFTLHVSCAEEKQSSAQDITETAMSEKTSSTAIVLSDILEKVKNQEFSTILVQKSLFEEEKKPVF